MIEVIPKEKTKEEIIRAQVHEILDIVLDGNGFANRSRKETGTLPTLFMDFSGHISDIWIRLYIDGWNSGGYQEDFRFSTSEVNSRELIDRFRERVNYALTNKKESEVLGRDIEQKVQEINDEKEKLRQMRRSLKKAQKRESIAG